LKIEKYTTFSWTILSLNDGDVWPKSSLKKDSEFVGDFLLFSGSFWDANA